MITCDFERYIKDDYMLYWKFLSLNYSQKNGINQRYHWLRWKYKDDGVKLREAIVYMVENFKDAEGVMPFPEIAKRLNLKEHQVKLAFANAMRKIKRKIIALEYEYRDIEVFDFKE